MSDYRDLAESLAVCSDEQLRAIYAALPKPVAPDVRRCVDEMSELDPESPHTASGLAACALIAAAGLALGLLT